MRYISVITNLVVFAIFASIAGADSATTQPIAPATQPAACDVFLIPFAALGGDGSLDWAGKAVQQNLLTDLARARLRVTPGDKPITVTADAQTAGKAAGAKFIITGSYQVADTLVRFNGQILDTLTGNVLGGISATGAPRDLFNLEDSLSAQALAQLTHQPAIAANNKPAAALPAALQPQVVIQLIQPPAVGQIGTSSSYQGSALQQYVESNRTPSTDFAQQVQDADDRNTYNTGYNLGYGSYLGGSYLGGSYFGGLNYGYGFGYSLGYSGFYGGYHHGRGRNDER